MSGDVSVPREMSERFMELGLREDTRRIRHIKNEPVTCIVFLSKVFNL